MSIKFANEIISEIEERESMIVPGKTITGEDFEKWLMEDEKDNTNDAILLEER